MRSENKHDRRWVCCGKGQVYAATLYDWKKKYPKISEALKKSKEVVDIQVENALLKRALGYQYDEVTREKVKDPVTGFSCLSITKKVTKEMQPDTTAQIFWLKNRRPDEWRDKIDVNAPGAQSTEDDPVTKSLTSRSSRTWASAIRTSSRCAIRWQV